MSNKKKVEIMYDDSSINITREVNFVLEIANKLRGPYKAEQYKDVIIPMLIIRRFECAIEPTKKKVIEKSKETDIPQVLCDVAKQSFYNTSNFDLKGLLHDSDNIRTNLKSYIDKFSENIKTIISDLKFEVNIDKMDKFNILYTIIKSFSELDLDPKTVDNMKMGYIFEDIIRRYSENVEAGDHYTPREVIRLMVNILLAEGCDDLLEEGKITTVLDMACGTGGMLSTAYDYLNRMNPGINVNLFGQEINDESHAVCLADMLIKGQKADRIVIQDTMEKDAFPENQMRFVIANPPFGESWTKSDVIERAIRADNKEKRRFEAGLPASSDMQLLMMQHGIYKLNSIGRAAIITNGSPLFSGSTMSGESQIRKWMFDNDYVEAIIGLPSDLFYNTNIGIFVFILSKNKEQKRKGKVQLIDARDLYKKLRKSLGKKTKELAKSDIIKITELYANFKENEHCKIFDNEDFLYKEVTVNQPFQRNFAITKERIDNIYTQSAFSKLFDEIEYEELNDIIPRSIKQEIKLKELEKGRKLQEEIILILSENIDNKIYKNREKFKKVINKIFKDKIELKKPIQKAILLGLSEKDKTADIYKDKDGNIEADPELKDSEIIPYKQDIDEYMKKEVYPFLPDAWYVNEGKIGAEISFTRYFYKYIAPKKSEELLEEFMEIEQSLNERVKKLLEDMGK